VIADQSAVEATNLVAGANEPDFHLRNVNHGRDWNATLVAEIALARAGDACRTCGEALEMRRGIEMGHVFKLGTLYAEKLGVYYLDEAGERRPCVMGCYGIGVERMLAAIIEANHDADGIAWPWEVAPFDLHVVVVGAVEGAVGEALAALEDAAQAAGLDLLVDDRDDSPGIKFKDADLLGMPMRVTVSPRALERGGVELRNRRTGETRVLAIPEAVAAIARARSESLEAGP
jgi:prolyl-tRNA synthetase